MIRKKRVVCTLSKPRNNECNSISHLPSDKRPVLAPQERVPKATFLKSGNHARRVCHLHLVRRPRFRNRYRVKVSAASLKGERK